MRLADLVTGGQTNHASSKAQQVSNAQGSGLTVQGNAQTRSLAPGHTLQGEVVARNGSEVQIKLSDDTILNAKVDQNVNLEVGKTVTFEVRSNGRALTLSPLFANTAADVNVLKAIGMAALPTNQNTVAMTELMMKAGLPVGRNSLQQVYREINAFAGVNVADIIDLHKLGLAVNEENLTQIASYKNLTHQLVEGMHTVMEALGGDIENMVLEGDTAGAAKMFQELLQMIEELPGEEENIGMSGENNGQDASLAEGTVQAAQTGEQSAAQQGTQAVENGQTFTSDMSGIPTEGMAEQAANVQGKIVGANIETLSGMLEGQEGIKPEGKNSAQTDSPKEIQISGAEKEVTKEGAVLKAGMDDASIPLTRELMQAFDSKGQAQGESYNGLMQKLALAEENGDLAQQAKLLQQVFQQGLKEHKEPLLAELLRGKHLQKFMTEGLSKLWTIEPKDVAGEGKVDELYQRLNRQLKSLTHMLEQGSSGTASNSYKAVTNMTQNLDFLQQLNQAYTYVQLPLRLQQGDAHGDLYVYTNKRNLAAKDGQISALLHLDMENLGPVDVYVAMQAGRVSTRFYVQDDDMLDFLEEHMDILTDRLQKRGYNCSFEMKVRDGGAETASGLNGLQAQEHAMGQPLGRYAFDVRA